MSWKRRMSVLSSVLVILVSIEASLASEKGSFQMTLALAMVKSSFVGPVESNTRVVEFAGGISIEKSSGGPFALGWFENVVCSGIVIGGTDLTRKGVVVKAKCAVRDLQRGVWSFLITQEKKPVLWTVRGKYKLLAGSGNYKGVTGRCTYTYRRSKNKNISVMDAGCIWRRA